MTRKAQLEDFRVAYPRADWRGWRAVPEEFTRIISDLHYGEHASRVRSLSQLRPLLEDPAAVVVNGDAMDSRPGPDPLFTARCRAEVRNYFEVACRHATFVTGNHDPDFSQSHHLDLAEGGVLVTHGDILFDDIVPWSVDAPVLRARIREALASLPQGASLSLEEKLQVFRNVAASIPQRHQAEQHGITYALKMAGDSVWPPWRLMRVIKAWYQLPRRGAALTRLHRPKARFCVLGHTHHVGVWRAANGVVVVNTGALCFPFHAFAVDVSRGRLVVRTIVTRGDEFQIGRKIVEFRLG
jgi:predicted phosphodiesterase